MKARGILAGLLIASSCFASDVSMWFGVGQAKEDISVEIGLSYKNWGANIYNAGSYDYSDGEVEDSRPPHNSYIVEKDRIVGGVIGIDLMYIFQVWRLNPFVEGGLTFKEKRDVAISTAVLDRGTRYTLSKKTRIGVAGGVGIFYNLKNFRLGVELHTEKGIMGLIGVSF